MLLARDVAGHSVSADEPAGVTELERLTAVGIALVGAVGAASAYTCIRGIGTRATATHSVAAFSLYSTIVSAALMWIQGERFIVPPTAAWCGVLVLIGIFGLGAQILAAMGLQAST